MSAYSFTKLFSSITDSSIWCEDSDTRVVWVTLLAMADVNGEIQAAVTGLAKRAAVSLEKTELAISKFMIPDQYSRDESNDGRRIEKIQGGWRLLNYQKYRELRNDEERKVYKREWMRKNREQLCTVVDKCGQDVDNVDHGVPKQKQRHNLREVASLQDSSIPKQSEEKKEIPLPPLVSDFESVWAMYPDKAGKTKAQQAYAKARKAGIPHGMIVDGLQRYIAYVKHQQSTGFKDLRFKNGATWFNQQCWNDEYKTEKIAETFKPRIVC